MKTFIWNTETRVYIVVAEDLEKAKWLLKRQFIEKSKEELIDEKDKQQIHPATVPSYVLARAQGILEWELPDFLEIWNSEPEYILEDKSCVIYNHENQ
jgi:hypothetical protein